MISLMSMWLPVLVSGLVVFVASSIIHMFLKYHSSDFGRIPDEDGVREALGRFDLPPGEYVLPHAGSTKVMGSPEFIEKANQGPNLFMTVLPRGVPGMGSSLALWFVYCLAVSFFAAYLVSRFLAPGTHYLSVFRFVGTVAFMGYVVAGWQNSIWYKRKWSTTLKNTFDGLVYALLTAGVFGWLWPAV